MIFVTVGTQLGFPRLIQMVDELAEQLGLGVVAQTGKTDYVAKRIKCYATMTPEQYDTFFKESELVIAHAGIGTILSAKKVEKPLIILPRVSSFGEHRNDHQLATAAAVKDVVGIYQVSNMDEMSSLLLMRERLLPAGEEASASRAMLVDRLRAYLATC
jgi:UDP-N-acetylglucosamine transferase subunit ALG13